MSKKYIPWNKGLTKKDDERIRRQAELKSKWWKDLKNKEPKKYKSLCKRTGGVGKGIPRPHTRLENAGRWAGGKYTDKRDGYVFIYRPDHPNARSDGYVLEHRLIMSEFLGRPITRDEDINHLNGKKDDNRPENLRLVRHYAHYEEMRCPKCEFKFLTR